jgi:hypothetical protein
VQEGASNIHRFVQALVLTGMSELERCRAFDAVLTLLVHQFPRESEGQPMWNDWERCGSYLPHVLFLCKRFQQTLSAGPSLSTCTWYTRDTNAHYVFILSSIGVCSSADSFHRL